MSAPSKAYLGAGTAAFLAMALAGWHLAGDPPPAAAATAAPGTASSKASTGKQRRERNSGPPAHVRERLAAIRDAGSSGARMQATISLASGMPVSEVAEWMENHWFDAGEGFDLTLFMKIAMPRWEEEDPEGFVAWSIKEGSGSAYQLLRKWSEEDPARALEYFRAHPNDRIEMQMLPQVAKKDPLLALARLQEIIAGTPDAEIRNYYDQSILMEIARQNPAALEAAMDTMSGTWKDRAESALAGERLKTSFDAELENLMARPDGWKVFSSASDSVEGLGDKLLERLADLPPSWLNGIHSNYYRFLDEKNADRWLEADLEGAGMTKSSAENIQAQALYYKARKDPEGALAQLLEMDLNEVRRQNTIQNIFANFRNRGEERSETLEKMIALLEDEKDIELARKTSGGSNQGQQKAQPETPSDWLEQAAEAGPEQGQILGFVIRNWDQAKRDELASSFRTLPEEQKASVAKILASRQGQADPGLQGDAILYLAGLPQEPPSDDPERRSGGENIARTAANYAVTMGMQNPDGAALWVQSLPAGDAKLMAQKNLAANWANYDPEAAGQWVQSLPAAARTEVQEYLDAKK